MHHLEALAKLKAGNLRFVSGLRSVEAFATSHKRIELAEEGQKPFAIVLSCSDSRAPSELIFDCGLGDLFVVRVAGNIVAPSLIGSIEFAAESFGTQLCLVMGHTQCGAVSSAVKSVLSGTRPKSDNVQKIVLEIAPSVRDALKTRDLSQADLLQEATRRNVERSIERLTEQSSVIADLVARDQLKLVGATYDLHSGVVSFLEDQDQSLYDRPALAKAAKQDHVSSVQVNA